MTRTRFAMALAGAVMVTAGSAMAQPVNPPVVISQVYGGGGNTGAPFQNDFIELFNRSADPVDISGWTVQYASAAGTTWQMTGIPTPTILQPGQYFLVQEGSGAGNGVPLPTPDAFGIIAMSASNGKVALVNTGVALTGSCPTANATVIDFVGFGSANCFEGGGATAVLSNSVAAIRANHGCTDTNNNNADFSVGVPNPRTMGSVLDPCTASVPPSGVGSSMPAQVCRNQNVVMTVAVMQGSSPASPITTVIGDASNLGGGPGVAFLDDGVAPDAAAGDGVYTAQAVVGPAVGFFTQNVPVAITDMLGRVGAASVAVGVIDCNPRGFGRAEPAGVCVGGSSLLTVSVTPGSNPPSTGLQVIVDLSGLGGSGSQSFFDDGTSGDVTAGDNIFSFHASVPAGTLLGPVNLGATIFDNEARANLAQFSVNVVECTDSGAGLVISQVYGGGGNSGATLTHDFVELFNRTNAAIDLTGKSLQYSPASTATGFSSKVDLVGSVGPGRYFLVQLGQGAGGTTPLPAPDQVTLQTDTLFLSATGGRVALVNDTVLIGADCGIVTTIADLVGYGGGTNCFEGAATAPTTDNTSAVHRLAGGCQDNNQNVADFVRAGPSPRNSASPANLCNPPTCPADFNGDGDLNPDDLSDYITCFFTNASFPGACLEADFNGDGDINPDDLSDYITAFFTGC